MPSKSVLTAYPPGYSLQNEITDETRPTIFVPWKIDQNKNFQQRGRVLDKEKNFQQDIREETEEVSDKGQLTSEFLK